MQESQWRFDLKRCLDPAGRLIAPERIELGALVDTKKILNVQIQLSVLTHMEASVYLYSEEGPAPLIQDAMPLLVQSPLCRELNRIEDDESSLPRCIIDTWQAALKAMREKQPVSADCVGGVKTLWSCPILLSFKGQEYPKAAITVAAFPILNFVSCEELQKLFPDGNPELGHRFQQTYDLSLDGEKLKAVRAMVQAVAQAMTSEISWRYEDAARQAVKRSQTAGKSEGADDTLHQLVDQVGKVSHDVNNHLTSINLYAHFLHSPLTGDQEALENLNAIRTEAKQAIEKIRRFQTSAQGLLPGSEPPSIVEAPRSEKTLDGSTDGKRILIVDDERSITELIRRALQLHRFVVETSLDGEQAITMIESGHYDLIVADLKMPGVGGVEIFQHFSRHSPEIARRIVFLSGDLVSPHALSFLRDAQSLHLTKPCTIEELLEFVRTALDRVERNG
jgi:CheY-like chemotaxis protein